MVSKKTDRKKPSKTISLRAPKKKTSQSKKRSSLRNAPKDKMIDKEFKMKIAELERFASFPRLNPNPVLEVDSSGKIIFMNIAAKKILRKLNLEGDGEVFLPKDIHAILRGSYHKKAKEFYREVAIQDRVLGERLYYTPKFHAVRIYAHDITKRKKMEAEIRRAEISLIKERNFTSAVLSTAGALVIVLDLKGRIVSFNTICEHMTGYSFDEVKGKPFWDFLLIPEEVDPVKSVFKELKAGRFPNKNENYWVAKGGTRYHISWSNTALLDNKGEVEFIIGTGIDITAQRQAEEELKIKHQTIENEKNRLEAVMDALLQSEERFRLFMDNSPTIAWIKDEQGRYVYLSKNYEERFGVRLEDWRGKTDTELWPAEIATQFQKNDRAVLDAAHPIEVIEETINPDGSRCYWLNSKFPFRDAAGNRFVAGIGLDITGRKRAEQALRDSREDLNRAQAVANTGSWRMNIRRNELFWSDETYRIFGIPKGKPLTYETFLGTVHPDDREYVDMKWTAALRGEHYDIEHRIVVGDTVKWVRERAEMEFDTNGVLQGGFGTTQNITERKLSEEELKKAKDALQTANEELESKVQERTEELNKACEVLATERQRLFSVLEQIPAYVCLLTADYKFAYVNREFKRRFGDPGDRRCYEFLFDRQIPCEICQTFMVFADRKSRQWEWTGPDGKTYAIFDYPFTDIDGSSLILELGIDISQRKIAEDKLKESRKKLRNLYVHLQSAVEAERTKISREIHDEFGTILTALNIDLSWLEKKLPGDQHTMIERIKKDVELINSAIEVVHRISSELRPGVLDYLGLSSAVEWQVKEFANRTKIGWDIAIDMKTSDLGKDISIALFRILQESLTNVSRHAEASKINVNLVETDSMVTLEVADDGKGITEEQLSDSQSLGILGMRERVEYLGGDIDIKGIPNKGTRVTIRIPIAKQGYEK